MKNIKDNIEYEIFKGTDSVKPDYLREWQTLGRAKITIRYSRIVITKHEDTDKLKDVMYQDLCKFLYKEIMEDLTAFVLVNRHNLSEEMILDINNILTKMSGR